MDSFSPETLAIALIVGALAGLVRGITGFGGAMVMSPPLALLVGPLLTVPAVLLLESIAAAPMLVQTRRLVRWRVIGPIILAACVTAPIGAFALVSADPVLLRRIIAATVVVFSLLLLCGWRYRGEQRVATGLGLGAVAGTLVGATSMGGPPVILYLLAGPDRIETTRANLTFFVCAISAAGIAALWVGGVLGAQATWFAAALAPGYYGGMVIGTRMFTRFDDQRFRRFTLMLMMAVAVGILLA